MALVQATDASFANDINSGTVLVDFYADWCGPCKMIAPILTELAEEMGDNVKIVKVNVDNARETAMKYGVMSIPTLILFKDGNLVKQTMGFQPKPMLKQWIENK